MYNAISDWKKKEDEVRLRERLLKEWNEQQLKNAESHEKAALTEKWNKEVIKKEQDTSLLQNLKKQQAALKPLEEQIFEGKQLRATHEQQLIKEDRIQQKKFYSVIERQIHDAGKVPLKNEELVSFYQSWIINLDEKLFPYTTKFFQSRLSGMLNGNKGESFIEDYLKIMGNRIKYLKNIRLVYNDLDVEIDYLVFTSSGIYIFEVKNINYDSYIDERGFLNANSRVTDVVFQMNRQKNCVRNILSEYRLDKIPVSTRLIWSNQESHIKNNYPNLKVIYRNDLDKLLSNTGLHNFDKQLEVISKHSAPEREYLPDVPNFLEELNHLNELPTAHFTSPAKEKLLD
ncbi:MAG: NERD domain-containing protein, partial [Streptococcaceae bacterium]|nr:NERD domain-containing protein [Streptococcaceae bacterium]